MEKITMGGILKNNLAIIIFFISHSASSGQDYVLTFTGSGRSSSVSSVIIDNLTQGTSLTINGNDILHLKAITTGLRESSYNSANVIRFSPNPMREYSIMEFSLPETGSSQISIFDMTGREILRQKDNLEQGQHSFRINGIKAGVYVVRITSGKTSLTGKFISASSEGNPLKMEHLNSSIEEKDLSSKGGFSEIIMNFRPGDRLKFMGISGKYSTVIVETPESNININFNFYECTDADANNYPVVQIGNQIWMAENLKTTQFNDGSSIPLITSNSAWTSFGESPAYCWYNNDPGKYKNVYGALYNYIAVMGLYDFSEKLCPTGWHVPDGREWHELCLYIDPDAIIGVVSFTAGGKLKESGTSHWESPNTGATNETGYTALPGGVRNYDGSFNGLGKIGGWWSDTGLAHHSMIYNSTNVSFSEGGNEYGRSLRCIKDK